MYFSKITQMHWVPKNKLEEAIQHEAHKWDRLLIDDVKKVSFILGWKNSVEDLNLHYKRCRPCKVDNYPDRNGLGELCLIISNVVYINIYKVKEEY